MTVLNLNFHNPKNALTTVFLSLLSFTSISIKAQYSNPDGDGSAGNPIQINNLSDLKYLSETSSDWGKCFVLTSDIDASETRTWKDDPADTEAKGFTPIGTDGLAFTGCFDGGGFSITNLYIKRESSNHVGFFADAIEGEIRNLSLQNVNISGDKFVGALVGYCTSDIINCSSSGNVSGKHTYGYVGGLIGFLYDCNIENCFSNADAFSVTDNVGGFAGGSNGLVTNCYSTGNVSGRSSIGGFVGVNSSTIIRCYASGDVTGTKDNIGGLVGMNNKMVRECYATGNLNGQEKIGGIAGDNYNSLSKIYDCFTRCNITGKFYLGGILGQNHGYITNCYAICPMNKTTTYTDCISPINSKKIADCYCLQKTGNNKYGTALTQAEFADDSNFNNWDFTDIWEITKNGDIDNINSFPYLKWMQGYSVSFNANGGNGSMTTLEKQKGMLTLPANTFTRDGYSFEGWAKASGGTKTFADNEIISLTDNLELFAVWTPSVQNVFTITFDIGAHGTTSGTTTYSNLNSGDPMPTAPVIIADEGWTFAGWDIPIPTTVTQNATYIAQYSIKTYIVTFYDWDNNRLKTETVNYGNSATAPNEPTRAGYIFTGWDTDFSNVTSNLTITAQYTINTGLEDVNDRSSIEIYPNPVKDNLVIEINDSKLIQDKNKGIYIMNSFGRIVYFSPYIKNKQTINLSYLSTGIYFVTVGNECRKMVKQ